MTHRRATIAVVAVVSALASAGAATATTTPAAEGDPIVIGTLTSLTGNFAPWGL